MIKTLISSRRLRSTNCCITNATKWNQISMSRNATLTTNCSKWISTNISRCVSGMLVPTSVSVSSSITTDSTYTNVNIPQYTTAKRTFVMITETKAVSGDANMNVAATATDDYHPIQIDSSTSSSSSSLLSTSLLTDTQPQLTVTDSCWKRIRQLASKRNQGLDELYLRVFVDAGGCSGFTYQFELDTTPINNNDDIVFYESNNNSDSTNDMVARVVVDLGSYEFIKGSKLHYVTEMIKSNFEIQNNPQSESACGCGSSFAVKNFSKNPALH
jgi:iron-sulfur cluster assembly accessory protein